MKMITKVLDEGLLTMSYDRKRFHILAIGKDQKEVLENGIKIINEMQSKGYELVPFECVCEVGDEIEIHNPDGSIEKHGYADVGFGIEHLPKEHKMRFYVPRH